MNEVREAGRGTRAALVGAVVGLVTAIALGSSQFLVGERPEAAAQLPGYTALTLIYLSPYVFALIASRVHDSGIRGGLLVAVGLLSLASSLSLLFFSVVTVIFLPATFLILFAGARSLSTADRLLATAVPATVVGLFMAAIVSLSFFALLWMQDEEIRCWQLLQGPDGQFRWETYEGSSSGPFSGAKQFSCTDIFTNAEIAMSMGILAIALLSILVVFRLQRSGH